MSQTRPNLRLGIDVGGTNTDAVLMDGDRVVAWHKVATGRHITDAIVAAAGAVLQQGDAGPEQIFAVMLGTTQFTNAVIERRRLNRARPGAAPPPPPCRPCPTGRRI